MRLRLSSSSSINWFATFVTPVLNAKKFDVEENLWQARVNQDWRFYFRIEGAAYLIRNLTPTRSDGTTEARYFFNLRPPPRVPSQYGSPNPWYLPSLSQ